VLAVAFKTFGVKIFTVERFDEIGVFAYILEDRFRLFGILESSG
jgi:hypothetical protein